MQPFTHIESIHQVAKYVQYTIDEPAVSEVHKIRTGVSYRGTVKLHGTNAGVGCFSDKLVAQSRTREISIEDDHEGFAKFIAGEAQSRAIREIEASIRKHQHIAAEDTVYLYGEWCGKGIMKGTAINGLPDKQFVLFSVRVVSKNPTRNDYVDALFSLGDSYADARIFSILDVPTWTLYIDFSSHESKQAALDTATSWTDEVEAQCPWGAKFGLTGIGEGIVWVPVGEHWGKPELCFKTKGEKHKKVHSKRESPQMDPEVLSGITEFVEFSTPESRLEQGLEVLKEQGHPVEMRSMGHFLKWVTADVQRECAAELEASGLDWKQVQGAIQIKAREFFKKATANF